MEVDGRIMVVNVVGEMVEVGGKVIEVDEVDDEGVEVPALVACADPTLGEDAGAIDVLGATGFEAGRVNVDKSLQLWSRQISANDSVAART